MTRTARDTEYTKRREGKEMTTDLQKLELLREAVGVVIRNSSRTGASTGFAHLVSLKDMSGLEFAYTASAPPHDSAPVENAHTPTLEGYTRW